MLNIYELIKNYKCISIIGMEKNVGKTSLLNKLIEEVSDQKILGITSIGRDGEEIDVVTETKKPRIFVRTGTIIATARDCLRSCDITKEVLLSTNFNSPLGNIVIIRARSNGYVDIAGPSYNSQLKFIIKKMNEFGADMCIIDGALGRKSTAISDISDSTILATGAALSLDMHKVVDDTKKTVSLLNLSECSKEYKDIALEYFDKYRTVIVDKNYNVKTLDSNNSLDNARELKEFLNENVASVIVRGAITEKFLENIISNRQSYGKIKLIGIDGTRFFISSELLKKASLANIELEVLYKINLLFVSLNPWSPRGFEFDKDEFKKRLEAELSLPIINTKD